MRRKWFWWAGGLAVLAIAGGLGWYYWGRSAPVAAPASAAVSRGNVTETVLATGVLEAAQLVSVGARVSGRIEKLNVALGQDVAVGDLIAQIDSLDQENAVKSAEAAHANIYAQIEQQQAALTGAEHDLERAEGLKEKELISDSDYESAQLALRTAQVKVQALEAQLQQADLAVQSAKLNLERTQITAPVAGTIVAVLVDEGQTVNAVQSTPTIVKIANLDQMVVKAEISEADVPRVEPGQRVSFTIMGEPDNPIAATLRSIEPAPESIRQESTVTSASSAVYYNGLFDVENPDHKLRISMTAQVTIVLAEANNVLTIPSSALGSSTPDGGFAVQVYDPQSGTTSPRKVQIGLDNNVAAEVTKGLSEGELVVTVGTSSGTGAAGSNQGGRIGVPGAGGGGMPPPGG